MSDTARQIILDHASEGARLREQFFQAHADLVLETARAMALCIARGGKLLICGNGGSAADAQHLAAEFVNRFLIERPPLPALALTTDSSTLTAIGNDYGFDLVFDKQIRALGSSGDILIAISTSGNSPNVVQGILAARDKGMTVIGLTGNSGGKMAEMCDFELRVDHPVTALVQEVHLAVEHLLCQLVDRFLFENVMELAPYLETPGTQA